MKVGPQRMPVWRIEPTADRGDARWLDHQIWHEVIVRAPSAAWVRRLAGELEREAGAPPAGNESLSFQSGFADEKLYRVVRLDEGTAARFGGEQGSPEILRAVKEHSAEPAP